ncbi:MAG: MBL fold metallo-hydrolase [Acidobacteria bacterium]|nr:MBL fold metallo-hydrolase [Acidobacteriota bacterium]
MRHRRHPAGAFATFLWLVPAAARGLASSRRLATSLIASAALLWGQPALAQIDISGEWGSRLHEDLGYRGTGPALGEYIGLPLNDAGRQKASTWDASILSSPEEQTRPHPVQYSMRGPGTNLRISKVFDPYNGALIAYTITGTYGRADRTIWMDGRPHPSDHAEHLWQGFSTGRVVANKLVVTTTHMKAGWVLRNYAPSSSKAVMTEYFVRHGDLLTMTSILEDPVYFEEPLVRTQTWVLSPNLGVDVRFFFETVEEVAGRPPDYVPHHPLGTRHDGFAKDLALPFESTQGGSETLYPDYIPKLRQLLRGEEPGPLTPPVFATRPSPPVPKAARIVDGIETLQVRPNVYMLVAGGSNITVQIGGDGVFIVDAGPAALSDHVVAAIRRLSEAPIRVLVNTHSHDEATGATAAIVRAGGPRTRASSYGVFPGSVAPGTAVIAHENVTRRLDTLVPEEAIPTSTFFSARKDLYFNGESIEVLAAAAAHTDSDILVHFRRSDVVVAGGLLDTTRYPIVDRSAGGSLQGIIRGLTHVIELTIPERNTMGGTLVIPGRGRLCNEIDVVEYRNMLVIIRDRIQDLVSRGATLEQVKAARVTLDYEGVHGASSGPWTTDMFIEAVYRELSGASATR